MGRLDWLSLVLDFCPGIGEVKAILELISGKDLITHEDLNAFDRASCAISIIPAAGWIAKISKTSKAAKHAKKFEKFFSLVNKADKANDAVDKLNFIRQILDDSGYDTFAMKLESKSKPVAQKNKKSVGELANEVIRGNWGNGHERKRRLEAAGYNYQEVQNEVNRKLKKK